LKDSFEITSAGHASEAILNHINKTRELCSLQYQSIGAAKRARFNGVRSLVFEWQGRELVKSAAYPQLSEKVQLPNMKVAITLLFLSRNKFYVRKPAETSSNLRSKKRNRK